MSMVKRRTTFEGRGCKECGARLGTAGHGDQRDFDAGVGGVALLVEVDLVHVAAERRGEMKPINASVKYRVARQAATPVSRPKILAMSRGVAPSTTRPRNSKSIETVWSAASIFP